MSAERLEPRTRAGIRDIAARLDGFHTDRNAALESALSQLSELLCAHATMAYRSGVDDVQHKTRLDFMQWGGAVSAGERRDIIDFCESRSVPWGAYNPTRPERSQRNRVWRLRELLGDEGYLQLPSSVFWGRIGWGCLDEMRVLVCDGPILLGWVGGYREERFGPREEAILRQLVPAFRRWLGWQARLDGAARDAAALPAALEALPSAAFILDSRGRVLHANSLAQQRAAKDCRTLRAELREAALRRSTAFDVTPISGPGTGYVLAIERPPRLDDMAPRLRLAAVKWKLTPRQTEVLSHLVQGHSNRTIAEWLGCGLRTVEIHVSALLERAGVESRAALMARFFGDI